MHGYEEILRLSTTMDITLSLHVVLGCNLCHEKFFFSIYLVWYGFCCRVESERVEWMRERDEKLEGMSAKVKELKTSLKERNRATEDLEKRLMEQSVSLEASRSQVSETEAVTAELLMKLSELRRTVAERDDQLQTLRDELTTVCLFVCMSVCLCVWLSFCVFVHVFLSVYLSELRQAVAERDDQLLTVRDKLTTVCIFVCPSLCLLLHILLYMFYTR